ncbi:hypothetical protein ACJ4V0_07475 [Phreatobacter sp. HK31-P]
MADNTGTRLAIAGIAIVGALVGAFAYSAGLLPSLGAGIVAGQMPQCDSRVSRDLLRDAIDKSPRALQTGLKLSEIGTINDYIPAQATDPNKDIRFCQAKVFTNGGSGEVHFALKWMDQAKSRLWLEVTLWTF